MFNIAILEDDRQDANKLRGCLDRYALVHGLKFKITVFSDTLQLINSYKSNYDILFADIEMPVMSGMEAARAIRRVDRNVTIVFVTNMAQYAIEGYSVEAFDYLLKPIGDASFELKLKRILAHAQSNIGEKITIRAEGETVSLQTKEILYLEVNGHYIDWHTFEKTYRALGALKSAITMLPKSFCAISRWYIVNMQHIRSVWGEDVTIETETLRIGRSYKQEFLQRYADYMVGG